MKNHSALFLIISSLIPSTAFAGAWLQEKQGHGELITSFRTYSAGTFVDSNGDKSKIPSFTKTEISPYFEYGLRDWLTLGGEMDFAAVNNKAPNFKSVDEASFSYGTIFARTYLASDDYNVLSIEPGVTFPYTIGSDLTSDGDKPIPELKLSYGYSSGKIFIDTSAKYRYRYASGLASMIKTEAKFGYNFNESFTLISQISQENTLGGDAIPGNYNLTRPQISALYNYSDHFSHQLGVYKDIYGVNTGLGFGFVYSLWYKF